jgi:predicted nucleic acid-binding protein
VSQSVAEARYGALSAGWGQARTERLSQLIARARVLPVDIDTIETVARLRNECRQIGHGLHQRNHNADLWIAATAIRWSIPLVAIFSDCPGLELRTEIDTRPRP